MQPSRPFSCTVSLCKDNYKRCRPLVLLSHVLSVISTSATVLLLLFFSLCYVVYEVQYKTGIEIFPFIPIDDSGFEEYSEQLLSSVRSSPAARNQNKSGTLLCWAMTTSIYHKTRVQAINETWFNKCDASHLLTNNGRFLNVFTPFHTVFHNLPESYFKLFWKTRLALYFLYNNVSSEFDWYFKADDDTYVVVDNLRRYLSSFDPNQPHFIGYRLRRRMPEYGYNAGGSGYVMSRAAMRMFAEKLFHDKELCPYHEWEDYAVARCLSSLGIYPKDSRDEQGRQRFLPWRPEEHYHADLTRSFIMDPVDKWGLGIFHENLISMHHLTPDEIRLIHGMLYGVAEGIWKNRHSPITQTSPNLPKPPIIESNASTSTAPSSSRRAPPVSHQKSYFQS